MPRDVLQLELDNAINAGGETRGDSRFALHENKFCTVRLVSPTLLLGLLDYSTVY